MRQMSDLLFSIVCPVYNAYELLHFGVESVLNQTYKKWELILVDDGSTDGSGFLCDAFSKQDKRIKTIHQNNRGQSAARLEGINNCTGDYILFLDSDDYYEISVLESLAKELNCNQVDAILFNAKKMQFGQMTSVYFFENKKTLYSKFDVLIESFSKRIAGYFWTYCFKKELFELPVDVMKRFAEIKYSEDLYLIFRIISLKVKSLTMLPEHFYTYLINEKSITQNQTAAKVRDRLAVFNEIYSELKSVFDVMPNKAVRNSIGWMYLSCINRAAKEYEYPAFREVCLWIRKSFIFKKMSHFKKDKNNLLIHFLFTIRMYKTAYKIIRSH